MTAKEVRQKAREALGIEAEISAIPGGVARDLGSTPAAPIRLHFSASGFLYAPIGDQNLDTTPRARIEFASPKLGGGYVIERHPV
jgi:hypothetical protein